MFPDGGKVRSMTLIASHLPYLSQAVAVFLPCVVLAPYRHVFVTRGFFVRVHGMFSMRALDLLCQAVCDDSVSWMKYTTAVLLAAEHVELVTYIGATAATTWGAHCTSCMYLHACTSWTSGVVS